MWGRYGKSWEAALIAAAAASLMSAVMSANVQAQRVQPLASSALHRPANGLIVKLKAVPETALALGTSRSVSERIMSVSKNAGLAATRASREAGETTRLLEFGRLLSADEAERMSRSIAAQPGVEWVEPNVRQRRLQSVVPDDPYYGSQWWLQPVSGSDGNAITDRLRGVAGFQSAWATSTGFASAVVAVLDTGIVAHPDLDLHVLPGYDFVSDADYANDGDGRDANATDPGDWVSQADIDANPAKFQGCAVEASSWHGTEIAGLIGAVTNNTAGVAGINWNAAILPVRVAGKCGADLLDIVDGMRWAAGLHVAGVPDNPNPARILNISFGGSEACGNVYQQAINDVTAAKAVVVAAAGNEQGALTRPASCNGVVAVGAVNRDGFKTNYSNFGAGTTLMTTGGDTADLGRWGPTLGDGGLLTLGNDGSTSPANAIYPSVVGSSFSAPQVSGAISLMLSVNSNLTVPQIISGLMSSARPHVTSPVIGACSAANPGRCICTTSTCGAGLLDAAEALRYAQTLALGGVYTPPNWSTVVLDSPEVIAAAALGQDVDGVAVTPPVVTPTPTPGSSDDSGGGAVGTGWLIGLAAAVVLARRATRQAA